MTLEPSSPLPLYHQLADELLRQIRAGAYPPGERIPSEHELARRYGLGRPPEPCASSDWPELSIAFE